MTKNKAKKLIEEFEQEHSRYSLSVYGFWKKNWRKVLKHADLKNGYWYWRGYKIHTLLKKI